MNPFYSILYCPIRPIVDERLSIALIVRTEDKVYFRFSHDKLKVIKELLPLPAFNLLKASLNNIEHYISNKAISNDPNQLIIEGESKITERFFQKEYFQYLNSYSNNLLHFSEPKNIDLKINEEIFNNLYWKLIFESDFILDKKELITTKVRNKVNPKIQSHVNIDVQLDSKHISGLIVPTPVWFIGKNEKDVTGEVLDFDKQTHHLENDIREHLYLLNTLRNSPKYTGTHFFVGKEPKKTNQVNHSIWNGLRGLNFLTYVAPNETEQITEYIKKHAVIPFFETEADTAK
jgi:hypothetical protein